MAYVFTNEGMKVILDRFGNAAPTRLAPTLFSAGTGTTDAAVADTDLQSKIPITGLEIVDSMDATTSWTDNADNTISVNSTTYVETAALNFTKDGTASVNAYSEKTTTSLDYTSKNLCLFVYIKDAAAKAKLAATGIEIRFGSDSSNYYRFDILSSALAVGWNFISKSSAQASATVGSPVIAASDYTRITFIATGTGITWSAGDFIVDYIFLASSDDYFKAYEVGYPSIDYNNYEIQVRSRLSSLQGNGLLISEYGSFNADATKKLISRAVFTGFSKGDTDELIFSEAWTFSNVG